MPAGESLADIRDRAILKFYLYTGARIETGCKLNVSDFFQEGLSPSQTLASSTESGLLTSGLT
jgi:hypothetical protein